MATKNKISVIVPVLNEAGEIRPCLEHLERLGPAEVILADGGSSDGSLAGLPSGRTPVRVVSAPRGRTAQMNRAAEAATGDVLLFCHADVRLPPRALSQIDRAVREGAGGGGFMKRYAAPDARLSVYAFLQNRVYTGLFRRMVGTNSFFVSRELFFGLGGYPRSPLLEDVIFWERVLERTQVKILTDPVTVSARRYQAYGVLRQILLNIRILLEYYVRLKSPEKLKDEYERSLGRQKETR